MFESSHLSDMCVLSRFSEYHGVCRLFNDGQKDDMMHSCYVHFADKSFQEAGDEGRREKPSRSWRGACSHPGVRTRCLSSGPITVQDCGTSFDMALF